MNAEDFKRKLAAIFSADVKGYLTIKEGREEDCLKLMKELTQST